jgi:hypothetical protein
MDRQSVEMTFDSFYNYLFPSWFLTLNFTLLSLSVLHKGYPVVCAWGNPLVNLLQRVRGYR